MTAMRHKSIILKPHEVVGILAERQTQIRRILKPQPPEEVGRIEAGDYFTTKTDRYGCEEPGPLTFGVYSSDGLWTAKLPFERGDVVFGKETWAIRDLMASDSGWKAQIALGELWLYQGKPQPTMSESVIYAASCDFNTKWRSSIHMPQWAARIWLRIGEVKVQRAQDAQAADCYAEGALRPEQPCIGSVKVGYDNAMDWLRSLWNSNYGPDAWGRNDWTVVYRIEAVERPEGA